MIIDQLFNPTPLQEGGPYDLPGKDYPRPGDSPRKQPSGENNPYPYSPEEDADYFREIFRKKREAAAKAKEQGMAEEYTRGAWKDEALDYKDFADLAYEKLTGAYGDKRRGIAQYYSRLENRTFGSAINQHGYTQLLIDLYKKANRDFTNPQDDTDTLSGTGFGHVSQREQGVAESKRNKQRRLNEALLMEDPIYRDFKRVGQYIAEQKLTEPEILQIFSNAETGMTDKGTGANRTFLGRGKDTTMDFAGGVADALKGVWSGIQNSVPVAAVDVAYDQATDALADLTGGQKSAVMQAIKKYRNLAKQYPKTAGLSKAALVAIVGLATGGA